MDRTFCCPFLDAEVALSDARSQHIMERHPGTLPDYLLQMAETLNNPDLIRRGKKDINALLFSKWFDTIRTGRYLVVVVINDEDLARRWIITAYTARKIAGGGEQIWPVKT